jgi:hypothetical protein
MRKKIEPENKKERKTENLPPSFGGFPGIPGPHFFTSAAEPTCVSKANTPNPKDLFGQEKVSVSKLPFVAVLHGAHAMMNGAEKYGAFNWRDKPVIANIYVDALMRHVMTWFEGQETAGDSGVHHLGHVIACAAILLDAQETGNLIDNRPVCGKPDKLDVVLERLKNQIKARRETTDESTNSNRK